MHLCVGAEPAAAGSAPGPHPKPHLTSVNDKQRRLFGPEVCCTLPLSRCSLHDLGLTAVLAREWGVTQVKRGHTRGRVSITIAKMATVRGVPTLV